MVETKGEGDLPKVEELVRLESTLIMARASLSPREMAERRRAGRIELEAPADGQVFLEVGGVVVAAGRLVRRRGRRYFRVERQFAAGGREEAR